MRWGAAKSAAVLARIRNGTGGLGPHFWRCGKRWWRARKLLAGGGVWGVGSKTLAIGRIRHLAAWGVQHLLVRLPLVQHLLADNHAGKVPPMTKGCRGRLANDEKVRCRLWNDEYVWRVVV